jgi:hypothetical protein
VLPVDASAMSTTPSYSQPAHGSAAQPPGTLTNSDRDVRRLGEDLLAQTDEVVRRTVARSRGSGVILDAVVEERFERVGEVSTIAVARWIAGESPEAAMEIGRVSGRSSASSPRSAPRHSAR